MIDDLYDWLRILDLVLVGIVLAGMAIKFPHWRRQPLSIRLYGMGLLGLLLTAAVGCVESILTNLPGGSRTIVLTGVLCWLVIATFIPARRTTD